MSEKQIDKAKLPKVNDYFRNDGVCVIMRATCTSDCRQCNMAAAYLIGREVRGIAAQIQKFGYIMSEGEEEHKCEGECTCSDSGECMCDCTGKAEENPDD